MKRLLILFICLAEMSLVFGQDIHLTQFYAADIFTNPAFAGKYDGDYRVGFNYRNQWRQVAGAIESNMISLEKRVEHYDEFFGIGFNFINDRVGNIGLQTNKIYFTGAYEKDLGGHLIRFGLQGGMAFRNFDLEDQSFPDQWNYGLGDYDQSLSHGETNLSQSVSYMDFNLGVNWVKKIKGGLIDIGYALHHLNKPKYGFVSTENVDSDKLPMRHLVTGSVKLKVTNLISIKPYILWMSTTEIHNMIFGVNAQYKINDDWKAFGGIGNRRLVGNGDAFIAMIGAAYKRLEVRFSNDFTTSSLNYASQNKSALEFSVIYITASNKPHEVALPCDRY